MSKTIFGQKFDFWNSVVAEGMKCYWCTDAISGNYNTFDPNALLDQKTTTYLCHDVSSTILTHCGKFQYLVKNV